MKFYQSSSHIYNKKNIMHHPSLKKQKMIFINCFQWINIKHLFKSCLISIILRNISSKNIDSCHSIMSCGLFATGIYVQDKCPRHPLGHLTFTWMEKVLTRGDFKEKEFTAFVIICWLWALGFVILRFPSESIWR